MKTPATRTRRSAGQTRLGRRPLGAVAALMGAAALLLSFGASAQKINDVPMAVKNNVAPNFMFMIDNSGSMTNIVPTAPFNPATDYTPTTAQCALNTRFVAGTTVDIRIENSGGARRSYIDVVSVPSSGVSGFPTNDPRRGTGIYRHSSQTPTSTYGTRETRCFLQNALYPARLVADGGSSPDGYLSSEYTGNYLNWYFSTRCSGTLAWSDRKPLDSTAACAGVVETRMQVAKGAGKTLVDSLPLPASTLADPAVRVGLSTYNNGNGGQLRIPIKNLSITNSTNTTTDIGRDPLKTAIDALSPSGNTPLAETLTHIGRYLATGPNLQIALPDTDKTKVAANTFFAQSGLSACLSGASCGSSDARPIQQWCQRSYVFMLTDGRSQGDQALSTNTYLRDYDKDCSGSLASDCSSDGFDRKKAREYESQGSDYLDDVAQALYDIDLRPDLTDPRPPPADTSIVREPKKNNARTYVIGFADTQVKDDPLLINTAKQGGGKFLSAADNVELTKALLEVVTDAFAQDAASAAVSVANPNIANNDISYAPSYFSGAWYGDVQAFKIDKSTGEQLKPNIWSAQALLDTRSPVSTDSNGRKIVTFNGSVGVPFTSANVSSPSSLNADVINYLRGNRSKENPDGSEFRVRNHLLGDVINAEPVVMNYPGATSSDNDVPIVFQAANDGMLHAFDGRASGATAGHELWAYVPRAVHGKLAALTTPSYEHQYYVDGTPAVASVTGQGAMTRLLVGGLGKGGGAYFGLDITSYAAADESAAANKVKWEFTNTNLGYSFGTPLIVNTTAGWRVVVSSGYGNGTGGPNGNGDGMGRVWVLNPSTGAVVATYPTNVGTASAPAGLAHLSKPANTAPDAMVRYVYGGDLLGNVWRFDIVDPVIMPVKVAELRALDGTPQPITAPIEVGPVSGSASQHFLYVGTGRYLSDDDVPGSATATAGATQRQTIYGLIDDTTVSSPTALTGYRHSAAPTCPSDGGNGALTCQQITYNTTSGRFEASTNAPSATSRGWYLDLPTQTVPAAPPLPENPLMRYGRITGKPAITTGGTLAFTVNVPTATKCDPGGSSWFMQLSGQNGGAIPREAGGNTYYDAGFFLGNALASRVVVIEVAEGDDGNKVGLIQMSNRDVENMPINETKNPPIPGGGTATWRRIYWRQLK